MKTSRAKRPRSSSKNWKKSYRKRKAAFPMNKVPSPTSGSRAFAKVKNTWFSDVDVTPATQGASDLWSIGLNDTMSVGLDTAGSPINQRPYGVAEYETLYQQYRVRFCKVRISIVPGGTGTNYHLFAQLQTRRGDTTAMPHTAGGHWNNMVNSSKSSTYPLLDIGNDFHDHKNGWGFKRVFFPNKVLGIRKDAYLNDTAYIATKNQYPGNAGLTTQYNAVLDIFVANSTVNQTAPTSTSYYIIIKKTLYVEFIRAENI